MTVFRPNHVEVRLGAAHFGAVVGRARPAPNDQERRAAIRAEVEREVNGEVDPLLGRRAIETGVERFGDAVRHRDAVRTLPLQRRFDGRVQRG